MHETLETIRNLANKIANVTEMENPDIDYMVFLAEKILFLCEGDGPVGEVEDGEEE